MHLARGDFSAPTLDGVYALRTTPFGTNKKMDKRQKCECEKGIVALKAGIDIFEEHEGGRWGSMEYAKLLEHTTEIGLVNWLA